MSIYRIQTVQEKTGLGCKASVYNGVRDGVLTKPVKIGERAVGWPEHEVDAINAARIAGKSKAEIRELVQRLHAKRVELLTAV